MPQSRLDLDDALHRILAATEPVTGVERVAVTAAAGRVLAEAIEAPMDVPPFTASAMDGYALRSSDLSGAPPYRLKITGTSYAGRPNDTVTPHGGCVRIFTGALVPADLDAVVIQEKCRVEDDEVIIEASVVARDHVRPPGHDVARGTRMLDAGRRLSPFDAAWLAACGVADVPVRQRLIAGIFSTGDELLEPGRPPEAGRIFDANRLALRGLLAPLPVEVRDFGIVGDRREDIRALLQAADAECHVVLTSGGVSVGEADRVRDAVSEIGSLDFWRLNLKPGKPVAYGSLRRAVFFGLPGNPVSTIVTALMLARPVIERLCGAVPAPPLIVPARLRGRLRHEPGREEYMRGSLQYRGGELEVSVTGDQSSNRLASFARADCLIRLGKSCGDLADGSRVEVLPLHGLL